MEINLKKIMDLIKPKSIIDRDQKNLEFKNDLNKLAAILFPQENKIDSIKEYLFNKSKATDEVKRNAFKALDEDKESIAFFKQLEGCRNSLKKIYFSEKDIDYSIDKSFSLNLNILKLQDDYKTAKTFIEKAINKEEKLQSELKDVKKDFYEINKYLTRVESTETQDSAIKKNAGIAIETLRKHADKYKSASNYEDRRQALNELRNELNQVKKQFQIPSTKQHSQSQQQATQNLGLPIQLPERASSRPKSMKR